MSPAITPAVSPLRSTAGSASARAAEPRGEPVARGTQRFLPTFFGEERVSLQNIVWPVVRLIPADEASCGSGPGIASRYGWCLECGPVPAWVRVSGPPQTEPRREDAPADPDRDGSASGVGDPRPHIQRGGGIGLAMGRRSAYILLEERDEAARFGQALRGSNSPRAPSGQ